MTDDEQEEEPVDPVDCLLEWASRQPQDAEGFPDPSGELQGLLDYAPPRLTRARSDSSGPQTSPLDFYDFHISENLQLRRIVLLSSLVDDIASRVEKVSISLESCGLGPLPFNEDTVYGGNWLSSGSRDSAGSHTEVSEPLDIARFYGRTTANACMPLASQWILHPKHDAYSRILRFDQGHDGGPPDHPFVMDKFSLRVQPYKSIPKDILQTLNRRSKLDLKYLEGKNLATWMFLDLLPEGETALGDMVELEAGYRPITLPKTGYPISSSKREPVPKDARQSVLNLPGTDYRPPNPDRQESQLKRIYPNGPHTQATLQRGASRPVTARDLIQHAWTNAVRHDNTFIVFSTGNQERVGVRHRHSQTLYLSELIDVSSESKPAYGNIHAGLYLSILEDVVDRLRQDKRRTSSVSSLGKRRGSPLSSIRHSKRIKINSITSQMNTSVGETQEGAFWKDVDNKLLALVSIRSTGFDSPIPAACARVQPCLSRMGIGKNHPESQRDYCPTEVLKLVLGPCFSEGAIGKLHTATIITSTNDSALPQIDVVVKLAISRHHRRRVRREYDMYKFLWEQKVEGILPIYGLFEDYNNLATFLVMGKGGISLWGREFDRPTEDSLQIKVTPRERDMFVGILQGIHKAGVCHRDIHPGNLIIDTHGNGYIIDFDRAHRNRDEADQLMELTCLTKLLDSSIHVDTLTTNDRWWINTLLTHTLSLLTIYSISCMPSTTKVRTSLASALAWCPPELVKVDPNSDHTRAPGYFDRHLDDDLILQRVVWDDQLIPKLTTWVDTLVARMKQPMMIPTSIIPLDSSPVIQFESEVQAHYADNIMPYVCKLASALIAGSYKSEKLTFSWVTTPTGQRGAIADAFLRVGKHVQDRPKFLTDLAVWEFKRPQVANKDVMDIIEEIAEIGQFHWCRCAFVSGPNSALEKPERCKRGDHYTSDGRFKFTRKRTGPDTVAAPDGSSRSSEALRFRPIRSHASQTATDEDKAYHMLQQSWTNAVISDATYLVLTSGDAEFIGMRHRETRTLFLSRKITPTESNHTYIKALVGLFLQAFHETRQRDRTIQEIYRKKRGGHVLGAYSDRILAGWEVEDSSSRAYATNENESTELAKPERSKQIAKAHRVLSSTESIILVAPVPECATNSGKRLIRPELPCVWTRCNPKTDGDRELMDGGYRHSSLELGFQSVIEQATHAIAECRDNDSDEESDSFASQSPQPDLPAKGRASSEESEPSSQGTNYDLPDSESQKCQWVDDLPLIPDVQQSYGVLDRLKESAYCSPDTDTIEVFCETPISEDPDIDPDQSGIFRGFSRYNNGYILQGRIQIKVVALNRQNARQLILDMEAEYASLRRCADLMPERCRVYGLFQYQHVIPYGVEPKSGRQTYRLASNSPDDWSRIPTRYIALVTSPLGTPLPMYTEPLSGSTAIAFVHLFDRHHRNEVVHGKLHSDQLRILEFGESRRVFITGWPVKKIAIPRHNRSRVKARDHNRLLRRLKVHMSAYESMRRRQDRPSRRNNVFPPAEVQLGKRTGGPLARRKRLAALAKNAGPEHVLD
ncbi:hypothetical protein BDN72DRAFT_882720 [Pluteus cervinus]|uniref:Uncharacterized protein n=1 Tax=Pluteus cervinus TaxID=181527 RepID=A0ACD3A9J5_9AGAR|nr:hypothetical protein BDN72DRAFT_882720 [Pluteus cervinus]